MQIYETIQGDTFDIIAKKVYGNERLLQKLLEANPLQIKTVVFSDGIILNIPRISSEEASTQSQPPWRALE